MWGGKLSIKVECQADVVKVPNELMNDAKVVAKTWQLLKARINVLKFKVMCVRIQEDIACRLSLSVPPSLLLSHTENILLTFIFKMCTTTRYYQVTPQGRMFF